MKPVGIPVIAEDEEIAYLPMPSGMDVYTAPQLPEPEEMADFLGAKAVLSKTREALAEGSGVVDIAHLGEGDRKLLGQILGEGEVSVRMDTGVMIQESLLTGVWQVRDGHDRIEVGPFPRGVIESAKASARGIVFPEVMEGVMNAPSVLAELLAKSEAGGTVAHVINLTLLPMSAGDMAFIESVLGKGGVTILSRGYGNCRISSTQLPYVWWVQYYNSQDIRILDTLEVVDLPEVVRAAPEDIEDSLERLSEILQWVGI